MKAKIEANEEARIEMERFFTSMSNRSKTVANDSIARHCELLQSMRQDSTTKNSLSEFRNPMSNAEVRSDAATEKQSELRGLIRQRRGLAIRLNGTTVGTPSYDAIKREIGRLDTQIERLKA